MPTSDFDIAPLSYNDVYHDGDLRTRGKRVTRRQVRRLLKRCAKAKDAWLRLLPAYLRCHCRGEELELGIFGKVICPECNGEGLLPNPSLPNLDLLDRMVMAVAEQQFMGIKEHAPVATMFGVEPLTYLGMTYTTYEHARDTVEKTIREAADYKLARATEKKKAGEWGDGYDIGFDIDGPGMLGWKKRKWWRRLSSWRVGATASAVSAGVGAAFAAGWL